MKSNKKWHLTIFKKEIEDLLQERHVPSDMPLDQKILSSGKVTAYYNTSNIIFQVKLA